MSEIITSKEPARSCRSAVKNAFDAEGISQEVIAIVAPSPPDTEHLLERIARGIRPPANGSWPGIGTASVGWWPSGSIGGSPRASIPPTSRRLLTGDARRGVKPGTPRGVQPDQGVQFTAEAFTGRLESAGVAVSLDGRGRALDNVFVERLWRAVKYEDLYIRGYEDVPALRRGLARYFALYNHARLHQALGYRTPAAVYAMPVPCDLRLSLPASGG